MAVLDDIRHTLHQIIDAVGFHPDRAAQLHAEVDSIDVPAGPAPEPAAEPAPEPVPEFYPFGSESAPGG